MAEIKGIIVTCDRCGKSTVRKYIGEGELDGGFTKYDKYEPMPEGWCSHRWITKGDFILCPSCNEILQDRLYAFMNVKKEKI